MGIKLRDTHPADPSIKIINPDVFFRRLPAAGGASPIVKVEPIDVMRFTIKDNPKSKKSGLYFSTWTGLSFGSEKLLYQNVKKVVFIRESITLPTLKFETDNSQEP